MLTDGRPTEKTTWIVLPGDQSSSDQISSAGINRFLLSDHCCKNAGNSLYTPLR